MNKEMEIEIIRSKRKTIGLEISSDGKIVLRAPMYATRRQIDSFISSKEDWINRTLIKLEKRHAAMPQYPALSHKDLLALRAKAKKTIPLRVDYYADQMGLSYNRIAIKCQRTMWGSCSAEHNLNFNCLLLLTPIEVMDYVIVHELCHLIHLNHSAAFWAEVAKYMPNYATYKKWLKDNGNALIESLPDD
ncbi:MAG: M48 family metallopeptidase [Lachnospiraceae bacterium]|nr:M48 family metallopeptidase [Candidatus Colinaster equi]